MAQCVGYQYYKYTDKILGDIYSLCIEVDPVDDTSADVSGKMLFDYMIANGLDYPWKVPIIGDSSLGPTTYSFKGDKVSLTQKLISPQMIEGTLTVNGVSGVWTYQIPLKGYSPFPLTLIAHLINSDVYYAMHEDIRTDMSWFQYDSMMSYTTDTTSGLINNNQFGRISITNYAYNHMLYSGSFYAPHFSINSGDSWKPVIKEFLGKAKKLDHQDPDPNIDDSDGDKNRTPTDDIGGNTITDDDLPTLSVMDTGLVTLYNPTVKELGDLGKFLWSDAFSLDTFKKLFSDPFDTLLGLSILPVTPTVSGRHNIYFGNIDSGVSCNVVANQFLKVDMGSLTLSETYASAFDYAPSTQVDIYLPFIGSHGLNTNDVMGSTLHLIYKFDLLSGGCIAELFINHTSQGNKSKGLSYNPNMGLAYTFTGQCSYSIPLTSNNYNGMIQSLIQSVGTIGAIGASVATGNPALGVASVATSATTIGLQANTPTVQRSGSIGSSNALLSCLTPYLSVQRAHICKPGHFYSKRGIPSQVYVDNISSVGSGNYFQIADCADLHANGASDSELAEIKSILTSGAVW